MTTRNEIIAEPLTVYLRAYSGTKPAFPAVDRTPAQIVAAGWALLGARGRDSETRSGVEVQLTQEFSEFMGANEIKVSDRWRTSEAAMVGFALVDLSMATLAVALDQTVTTVSGPPDYQELGFGRPLDVKLWSLLLRGRTPNHATADNDKWRQLVLWAGNITSPYSEAPNRDAAGEIPFEFKPLALASEPEINKFGTWRAWAA